MRRREKTHRGPVTIYRENPPSPRSGVSIVRVVHGHLYEREVGPRGVLSPTEGAIYLGITREFLYRLIWAGKVRTVKKGGRLTIPLKSLKDYEGSPGRRRRRPVG